MFDWRANACCRRGCCLLLYKFYYPCMCTHLRSPPHHHPPRLVVLMAAKDRSNHKALINFCALTKWHSSVYLCAHFRWYQRHMYGRLRQCVGVSFQWRACINIPLNWHLHDETMMMMAMMRLRPMIMSMEPPTCALNGSLTSPPVKLFKI